VEDLRFVRVAFVVACDWDGFPPIYRVYVGDELFTERTYIFPKHEYLEEILPILASPGKYCVRTETLGTGNFVFGELKILDGPARIEGDTVVIE
jgi:hypothetical protein